MSPEEVGSLAEEAAKLLAAMQGWAAEHGAGWPDSLAQHADGGAAGDVDGDRDAPRSHHDLASPECRYCPICQLVRLAKSTSPEVREHLTGAALSLTLAAKALLERTTPDPSDRATPVEKIDLADD